MTFSLLGPRAQALQASFALIVLMGLLAASVWTVSSRVDKLFKAVTLLMLAASFTLVGILASCIRVRYTDDASFLIKRLAVWADCLPNACWIVLITVFFAWLLVWTAKERTYRLHSVEPASLKELCDDMPTALCYCSPSGKVLLVNRRMNQLSAQLFGTTVLNGADLWSSIGDERLRELYDGRSFIFTRNILNLGNRPVWEIIATDVTEEYALSRQLEENNRRLESQRDRYLEISKLIEEMSVQKEVLSAKTRVHDELGSTLLATRHYLEGSRAVPIEELRHRWKENLSILKSGGEDLPTAGYDRLLMAAADVGIDLQIDGELPEEPAAAEIMRCAIHESMTNTIRHAHGDVLSIKICRKKTLEGQKSPQNDAYYDVVITNNGEAPKSPVKETGGLLNLRQLAEQLGGSMLIQSEPAFRLKLRIPSERS